eukprot:6176040-Pleurochrysis_carterae.AAC.8
MIHTMLYLDSTQVCKKLEFREAWHTLEAQVLILKCAIDCDGGTKWHAFRCMRNARTWRRRARGPHAHASAFSDCVPSDLVGHFGAVCMLACGPSQCRNWFHDV